jgi:AcrR family transcriptional regulator
MTRHPVFNKEKIIEAAMALLRRKGWQGVTVRTIARELASSTMPIYSSKLSMEDLEWELRARTWALIQEYQRQSYTDNPLTNMAVGLAVFAREEPNLYRFLYVERPVLEKETDVEKQTDKFRMAYGRHKDLVKALRMVPEGIQNPVMLKSWIFVHGLASLLGNNALEMSEQKVIRLIEEAGGAFYFFEQQLNKEDAHE